MAIKLNITKNSTVLNFNNLTGDNEEDNVLATLLQHKVKKVYAETEEKSFSSLLTAELYSWQKKLSQEKIEFDTSRLPKNLCDLLSLSLKPANIPPSQEIKVIPFLERTGRKFYGMYQCVSGVLAFIKETFAACGRFICGNAFYRKKDYWFIFEDCSYQAVGITALVSFLVGLILAFVGALQLKMFGASIYVASMVALGMTRIMAAIMVGIIMAGRTGSSYAATLGTMQVNEEIDALKTLGIKISDYLIAPRLISLVLTIPFLTLLADFLGIVGGAVVGVCFLGISPTSYFEYSLKALTLKNVLIGLLHSIVYGIIIAIAGCYEGLTAGRDADAVGKATTKAVVTALVWMIVATGILTVLLEAFKR